MRKSHIQPSRLNQQGKEESKNLRAEKRNPASSSSEKKEALQRMPTEEDINASAEAFIKNFRQHLLLQRLQSIENYEQMLARGL
ncbi:hypothetical protein SESBI_08473 [Sesbania bispinosa]|nr:hypothetical protein SESBI_08473 [Sesbania bispinosa]